MKGEISDDEVKQEVRDGNGKRQTMENEVEEGK